MLASSALVGRDGQLHPTGEVLEERLWLSREGLGRAIIFVLFVRVQDGAETLNESSGPAASRDPAVSAGIRRPRDHRAGSDPFSTRPAGEAASRHSLSWRWRRRRQG
jgi:hypothetical protein